MKRKHPLAIVSVVLMLLFGAAISVNAGTVEDVKEGSKQAAKEIRDGATEAGKATVEAGKEIRDGSKKVWKDVKDGAKQVGEDFKKAYEDTRDAIRKEVSGEGNEAEATKEDTPQK